MPKLFDYDLADKPPAVATFPAPKPNTPTASPIAPAAPSPAPAPAPVKPASGPVAAAGGMVPNVAAPIGTPQPIPALAGRNAAAVAASGGQLKPAEVTPTTAVMSPVNRIPGEQIAPTDAERRQDFERVDSTGKPTDFVGFSEYAGLNDDALRDIADRAAGQSQAARNKAEPLLQQAMGEARHDLPVEKTPSYAKYLEALQAAAEPAQKALGKTGNYQEDSLRGLYFGAQEARDRREQTQDINRAGAAGKLRDEKITDGAMQALQPFANAVEASKKKAAADAKAAAIKAENDRMSQELANTMELHRKYADYMSRMNHLGIKKGEEAFDRAAWLAEIGITEEEISQLSGETPARDAAARNMPGMWTPPR
jgi:hypothetical protein